MIKLISSQRYLVVYSGILTAVFAFTVLNGATQSRKVSFGEIDVQRINLVEPDGTLRMVMSDKARFPGMIIKGKETPHPGREAAGLLFFNDEGTESGGLTFGGRKDKNGTVGTSGHLSFDQYEQDQVLVVSAQESAGKRRSQLMLYDRPDYPISELIPVVERIKNLPEDQQKAAMAKFEETHSSPHPRLYLGRSDDRSVSLKLMDTEGRNRIIIEVAPDGSPAMRFLDQNGKVIGKYPG